MRIPTVRFLIPMEHMRSGLNWSFRFLHVAAAVAFAHLLNGLSDAMVWARKGAWGLVFLDDKGQKSELKVACADHVQFLHQGYMTFEAQGAVGLRFGRGKAVLLALLRVHRSSEAAGARSLVLSSCALMLGGLTHFSEVDMLHHSCMRTFCYANCRSQRMVTLN